MIQPYLLQRQILEHLHSNHMGVKKTYLLARESVCWINMNADMNVKQCSTSLEYQYTQPHKPALHYDIPYKPWEEDGADILMVINKHLLCFVDYNSMFLVVKNVTSLLADDLLYAT